ncbi:MAG TPA: hypothetical protein PLT93_21345 [Phycisphaerae bacterium]|nr:hypothetical protein [Phycisphaerae bacterium]
MTGPVSVAAAAVKCWPVVVGGEPESVYLAAARLIYREDEL